MEILQKINRFFSIRIISLIEKIPWKILKLENQIESGLTLPIKNRADWNTYNEIFVRGDYNFAIDKALECLGDELRAFRFIDLGANVGIFTIKLIDSILKNNSGQIKYEGLLVEGSPKVYKELQLRLNREKGFNKNLNLILGLVGKRTGSAKIYESDNYITNSLSSNSKIRSKFAGTDVSYVDLFTLYTSDVEIDLLKCDIEGSELDFLENYQDLLTKVRVAVFELHHDKCNTALCKKIIHDCGLINQKTIFDYGEACSLMVFWK